MHSNLLFLKRRVVLYTINKSILKSHMIQIVSLVLSILDKSISKSSMNLGGHETKTYIFCWGINFDFRLFQHCGVGEQDRF